MCTLSVVNLNNEIIVTMNRDEAKNRPELNIIKQSKSTFYPVDKKAGGTWIGVNQHGLVMALLNRYQDKQQALDSSRGMIIPQLLLSDNIDKELQKMLQSNFNPFDLLVWNTKELTQYKYDGDNIDISKKDLPFFISSSSVDNQTILQYRHQLFKNSSLKSPQNILENLHLKQDKGNPSRSIFMQRDKTHTKSITQIRLGKQITINYFTEKSLSENPIIPKCSKIL